MSAVTIRPAFPDDAEDLERLATLDSGTVPAGALLLAELDGVLAAALSIADGTSIADPFRPTAAVVELLARRAQQILAAEPDAARRPASRAYARARAAWAARLARVARVARGSQC